jgi:hypothetical protein
VFDQIKRYLAQPPVLQALKAGKAFILYIAATDRVLGAVLTQDSDGKEGVSAYMEGVIAYMSRSLLDAETPYTHVERICLSLYYACSKF